MFAQAHSCVHFIESLVDWSQFHKNIFVENVPKSKVQSVLTYFAHIQNVLQEHLKYPYEPLGPPFNPDIKNVINGAVPYLFISLKPQGPLQTLD